ncbi:MAG: hypothetical protein EOO89_29390 [Pedobacter sp.]|nr:MAG: hypothetical protein EOO89_29390 [Pedobacter sp.]
MLDAFEHEFEAMINDAKFQGIYLPKNTHVNDAFLLLKEYVVNPEQFKLIEDPFGLKYIF